MAAYVGEEVSIKDLTDKELQHRLILARQNKDQLDAYIRQLTSELYVRKNG